VIYEYPAYGIVSQLLENDKLQLLLEALPEREITIQFSKQKNNCHVTPYVFINMEKAVLEEVYVFANERKFWLPKVMWIEWRGKNPHGIAVKERINVN
jgi:Domain of unknown function (DUF4833)